MIYWRALSEPKLESLSHAHLLTSMSLIYVQQLFHVRQINHQSHIKKKSRFFIFIFFFNFWVSFSVQISVWSARVVIDWLVLSGKLCLLSLNSGNLLEIDTKTWKCRTRKWNTQKPHQTNLSRKDREIAKKFLIRTSRKSEGKRKISFESFLARKSFYVASIRSQLVKMQY